MLCGVAVAFYCLCLAPWRAGPSRRFRRANLPLSVAFTSRLRAGQGFALLLLRAFFLVLAGFFASTQARLLRLAWGWPRAVLLLPLLLPGVALARSALEPHAASGVQMNALRCCFFVAFL